MEGILEFVTALSAAQWLVPLIPALLYGYFWLSLKYEDEISDMLDPATVEVIEVIQKVSIILAVLMSLAGFMFLVPFEDGTTIAPIVAPMWAVFAAYMGIGVLAHAFIKWVVLPSPDWTRRRIKAARKAFAALRERREKRLAEIEAAQARSDKAIMRRARMYVRELDQAIGSTDPGQIRDIVREVMGEVLPGLLERRHKLEEHITATERDIERRRDEEARSEFRKELQHHCLRLLDRFQELLRRTETEIEECLDFLDLAEADVRISQVDHETGNGSIINELYARLRERISESAADKRDADEEVEAALRRASGLPTEPVKDRDEKATKRAAAAQSSNKASA